MSQSEGSGSLGAVNFLSTHPANSKRIKVSSLQTWRRQGTDDYSATGEVAS